MNHRFFHRLAAVLLRGILIAGLASGTEWKFRSNTSGFAVVGNATATAGGLYLQSDIESPTSVFFLGEPSSGNFTASLAFTGFTMHPSVSTHRDKPYIAPGCTLLSLVFPFYHVS